MKRLCPTHGIYEGSRCAGCTRTREQHRLSAQARGYDSVHRKARKTLASQLPGACGYGCGVTLYPDSFVAAHRVDGRPEYGWIASCRSCNERAKGRVQATL